MFCPDCEVGGRGCDPGAQQRIALFQGTLKVLIALSKSVLQAEDTAVHKISPTRRSAFDDVHGSWVKRHRGYMRRKLAHVPRFFAIKK